jgi:hypothetical protein
METVYQLTVPMTSSSLPAPTRDYAILTQGELRLLKGRASPFQPDRSLEAEKELQRTRHGQMTSLVSTWSNTIASNRLDRQTRLLREKEAEEQRKQLLDTEEKKIEKLKRQSQLAEARKSEFAQRSEVRAVNSQLLLHEVQMERELQQTFRERKRLYDMKKQIDEDEQRALEYEAQLAKERKIRQERRLAAIEAAKGFRQQRDEKEEQQQRLRDEQIEDEQVLLSQMEQEAVIEKASTIAHRQLMRQLREQNVRENEGMIVYKQRMKDIEAEEDRRIRSMAIAEMEENERRKAVDAETHRTKLLARERLIEAERQRQEATRTIHEDFLEKQLQDQYEKDRSSIAATMARSDQLSRERREEFLDSLALKAHQQEQRKQKEKKKVFPFDGNSSEDDAVRERDLLRAKHAKDLEGFQHDQAREKKERESAERERTRLEFIVARQKEQAEFEVAQEYAKNLLANATLPDERIKLD